MNRETIIVTTVFACCSIAHFVGMCVMSILARRRVQYLSLPWVLAIFCAVISIVTYFADTVAMGTPGFLNPYMMIMLVVGIFLQSIYSLGITMPGFLQWGRMVKYAMPLILLCIAYAVAIFHVGTLTKVYSASELFDNFFSPDLILRLIALFMGLYYVLNIFFLPFRYTRKTSFPFSLLVYSSVLILSIIVYLYLAFDYDAMLLCGYMVLFTLLNLFWVFHSLEMVMMRVPHPDIKMVKTQDMGQESDASEEGKAESAEKEAKRLTDFNEMNKTRYNKVQLWMQTHSQEWKDNAFTRDKLCEETGINRQLMLQCLRSQGHYNIHEYITTYRVVELKRMIKHGDITSINECDVVGFGSVQTARSCFLRIEGISLDTFFMQNKKA